ncbi:MAG TPA: hypothetical protein VFG04_03800 [Planctomycetaceae bacterium]|jgi:hypothetical protein|nr:hypothetical protein [Planctomycetaceae bacterium]
MPEPKPTLLKLVMIEECPSFASQREPSFRGGMPKLLDTLSEVAFALGTTQQNVSQWKQKGCPHLYKAPYDLDKIRQWADKNIDPSKASRKKVKERVELLDRKKDAETKIKELTARAMEWEEAVREKKLVWAEDWERALNTQADSFRKALLSVKYRWAAKFVGLDRGQAEAMLDEIAEDVLRVLHEEGN